jgi:hypothetical protein
MKMANREPRKIRERIMFNSVFAYWAYFAAANPAKNQGDNFFKTR